MGILFQMIKNNGSDCILRLAKWSMATKIKQDCISQFLLGSLIPKFPSVDLHAMKIMVEVFNQFLCADSWLRLWSRSWGAKNHRVLDRIGFLTTPGVGVGFFVRLRMFSWIFFTSHSWVGMVQFLLKLLLKQISCCASRFPLIANCYSPTSFPLSQVGVGNLERSEFDILPTTV